MKLSAVFALPLAVAGLLGATTIAAKADPRLSGIITGEVLCSLYRTGASPEVAAAEARRITKRMIEFGQLKPEDAPAYKATIQQVFNACPEPSLPDA